jgi:predicted esterase YcpF (UPF0227 family)
MTIYYIHGYGSNLESSTLKSLQKYFPVVGLTYDYKDPAGGVADMVAKIQESDEYPVIIASSLGGWYAEQLTNYISGDFIMYNPSTNPWGSLTKYGVEKEVLDKYAALNKPMRVVNRSIILSTDDEVIDYKLAVMKYVENSAIEFTTGGHRMTDNNLKIIADEVKFLGAQLC